MLRRSLLVFVFAACASSSPLGTQTTVPDPPAAKEDKPTHERPDFFWIHGHWLWSGNSWDWTSGHWEHERKGYMWSEGHWDKHDGRWAYTDGAWTAGEAPATPPSTGP